MKAVKINALIKKKRVSTWTRDHRHRVILGNHRVIYFTDQKQAKHFIYRTNEFLNLTIIEINSIFIEIWTAFKNSRIKCHNAFSYRDKQDINEEFHSIDKNIEYILSNPQSENGVFLIWKSFINAIDSTNILIDHIIIILKKANSYLPVDYFRVLRIRIERIANSLFEWGINEGIPAPAGINHDQCLINSL